jgi:hypothetical protein
MANQPVQVGNVIIYYLDTGVAIRAGATEADALSGRYKTDGPILASQRNLVDQVCRKVLESLHGTGGPITLNVRDDRFIEMDPAPAGEGLARSTAKAVDPNEMIDAICSYSSIQDEKPSPMPAVSRTARAAKGKTAKRTAASTKRRGKST